MTFAPKKSKFKKQFKGKAYTSIYKNISSLPLLTGSLGLKIMEYGMLSSKNFEAIKQTIKKYIKKQGRVTFIKFPQTIKTKKPLEIRMGKGKGSLDHWSCKMQPGALLCEIQIPNISVGVKALETVQIRIPLKTKIIFDTL